MSIRCLPVREQLVQSTRIKLFTNRREKVGKSKTGGGTWRRSARCSPAWFVGRKGLFVVGVV